MRSLVLVLLGLPAALTAQIQVRAFAHTDLVAIADGVVQQSAAAGTELVLGTWVIGAGASSLGCSASAAAGVGQDAGPAGASYRVSASGSGDPFVCQTPHGAAVRGAVRFEFSSPGGPAAGNLRVFTDAPRSLILPVSVDVLGDGRPEISGFVANNPRSGALRYPLVLDVAPTAVVVDLAASAASGSVPVSYSMRVEVRFEPGSTPFESVGAPCGPALESYLLTDPYGTGNTQQWLLRARNVSPTATAFLVFGTRALVFPAPPTNCPLLTDVLVPLDVPVRADGTAGLRFDVGAWAAGASIRHQCTTLELQGGVPRWRTSNAFHLRLP